MATKYQTSFILRALAVAFACAVLTGCRSFDFEDSSAVETTTPVNKADVIGQYQIQLIPSRGEPTVEKVDIVGAVTVQDALEASGATRKFGAMKITLRRIIKESGTLLKLPVEYEVRSKTVPDLGGQNYSLRPGDTIIVSPKESKTLEKVLESLTGSVI